MCKGNVIKTNRTYIQEFDNCIIIIKNVPALVCSQCGEVYYSDEIAEKLEEIVDRLQVISGLSTLNGATVHVRR